MHYPQAGLARAQHQPLQLRRNQVHGQHETDQSAAGEYGNRKCRTGNVPEDEEAAHVRVDRGDAIAASSIAESPSWPRQRLTLARLPPAVPGNTVSDTSTCPATAGLRLAVRTPLATDCVQPSGSVQAMDRAVASRAAGAV